MTSYEVFGRSIRFVLFGSSFLGFSLGLSPSGKPMFYQRFVSISSYCICCDLPMSITIMSIDTNLILIDYFSQILSQCTTQKKALTKDFHLKSKIHTSPPRLSDVQRFWAMASRQPQRTPHNVYTQKRTDRQFQDFIQHSKSKNLPIPNGLVSSGSKRSQAIDNAHPNALKRQRLGLEHVQFNFLSFFGSSLILFFSSLL